MLSYRKIINAHKLCVPPTEGEFYEWEANFKEAFSDSVCNMDSEKFESELCLYL